MSIVGPDVVTPRRSSADQRRALGSFLASRRARLKPVDFGLPDARRRTPGLRREEVATLAGVSVSWYTWLEQGRDIHASADTLRRVCDVLRLDLIEAAHLFALSSREAPSFAVNEELSEGLRTLLKALGPTPAYIRNAQLDILAWNAAVADLFVDYGSLEPRERNTLRLLFLHRPYRTLILDWEDMARGMISTFRAARARAQDQAPFDQLADELSDASHEFRDWWAETDVKGFAEGSKRLRHPSRGSIEFTYLAFVPEGRPNLSLVVYIPRPQGREPAS